MAHMQFDPFGETIAPFPRDVKRHAVRATGASRLALRLGVGMFWTLVVGIVAARVAFFDPTSLEKLGTAVAFLGRLRALVFA